MLSDETVNIKQDDRCYTKTRDIERRRRRVHVHGPFEIPI